MDVASVKVKILAILDANKGRVSFETVRDSLDYREQRLMINALRELKAEGIAQKQNRLVDGKPLFEVFRIGAPLPSNPPPNTGGA